MAVDLMNFPKMDDQTAIQEAASQGMKSMKHLLGILSNQSNGQVDCTEIADFTVSNFKKVNSLLNRTGHARFRRGPVRSPPSSSTSSTSPPQTHPLKLTPAPVGSLTATPQIVAPASSVQSHPRSLTLDFPKPSLFAAKTSGVELEFAKESFSVSSNSFFMSSAITDDGSVSDGKGSSIFQAPVPAPVGSSGKPPLAGPRCKKRCLEHEHTEDFSGKVSGSSTGNCHCSKRRKNRVKRTIRVPAISSKIADIPPDEHSWRKYGQKPIKGSPHPRGYYKCSTVRGCPARKHVERAVDEPTMLIVTYEGEHRHTQGASQGTIAPAGVGLVF